MKNQIVAFVLLIAASAAAGSLIAMRVETEALAAQGDETLMEVVVAIAPEDRARTGSTVWITGELRRGSEIVDRFDARAQVARDGSARFEKTWAPGAYDLRIDIESSSSDATGFWKGRFLVPRMAETQSPPAPPEAIPSAAPPPEPEPTVAEENLERESETAVDAKPEAPKSIADAMAAAAAAGAPESPSPNEPPPAQAPPATPARTAAMPAATVIVIDAMNNPVTSLRKEDFILRVGRSETPVVAMDAAGSELLLGFAVDISSTMAAHLPETRRMLRRLAERSFGPGSSLFVVSAGADVRLELGAGADTPDLGDQLRRESSAAAGNLADLVGAAFAQFDGHGGRKILVLVSDGGDTAAKARWKEVEETAASAGIPVLVVVFDAGNVQGRTINHLRRVAESSGGKYYSLRNTDTLRLTIDHFAELIEGSYALGFQPTAPGTQKLKVTTADRDLKILHSKAVTP